MRNVGDQVAFVKQVDLAVLGQATYEVTGPTGAAAMFIPGVEKDEWDRCVQQNLIEFRKIGFKIYSDMD